MPCYSTEGLIFVPKKIQKNDIFRCVRTCQENLFDPKRLRCLFLIRLFVAHKQNRGGYKFGVIMSMLFTVRK